MNREKFIIQKLHTSSKRDYLKRMNDNKAKCMNVGQKFDKEYWVLAPFVYLVHL